MRDIENRQDIETLIDTFYEKVVANDVIGVFFNEVIQLDWNKHIPVMYAFWEGMLLDVHTYKGNPMLKHIALNAKKPLEEAHFAEWIRLWEETVNQLFEGEKAAMAIARSKQIGGIMLRKVAGLSS